MTWNVLAWLVLLVPPFVAIGVYTLLLPIVGMGLAMIGGACTGVLLIYVVVKNLGKPIR